MANCETKFQLILLNSPERYDCRKIRSHGSSVSVANGAEGISDIEGKAMRVGASERGQRTSFNGDDGPTRHQRRALSARRSVGRTTSQWKLRSIGDQRDGVASLAIPDTGRRTEGPRISDSTCDL